MRAPAPRVAHQVHTLPLPRTLHRDQVVATLLGWLRGWDVATSRHCRRVAILSLRIGRELGMSDRRLARLCRAALMHDIGKLTVPREVLRKREALDAGEYAALKRHTRAGHGLLLAAGLRTEARFVLHHHERPDGSGYPRGLEGDAIPLESRIILAADAFDAITSDRPYRRAASGSAALAELERCAGAQFDPACVRALRASLARPPHPPAVAA
jgi:HD-GYP domain-containing protein (c-di-GMP phosphodiesterase class II)